MEDAAIVDLYWQRADQALEETEQKYGRFCFSIARNILPSRQDAEESVNDTWLAAWNAMPPHRPNSLKLFLGKITRRVSVSRLRKIMSTKRGGGEAALALEELSECIPTAMNTAEEVDAKELARAIDRFLDMLPVTERNLFIARYWTAMPTDKAAAVLGLKASTARSQLSRSRRKLRRFLEQEGLV